MAEESDRRVVLITGASSGIGAASARAFARRGFQVILAARRTEQLEHLADELRNGFPGCEAHPIQADVSRPEDIRRAVTSGLERFGKIDILFANAGSVALGWLEELDPEREIQDQLRTNLEGVVLIAREASAARCAGRCPHGGSRFRRCTSERFERGSPTKRSGGGRPDGGRRCRWSCHRSTWPNRSSA